MELLARPKRRGEPMHTRWRLLIAALVLVTVVNIARVADLQRYLPSSPNDLSSVDDATASVLVVHVDGADTTSAPQIRRANQADPKCKPLHKSHVEAKFYNESACYTQPQVVAIIKELVLTAAETFTAHNLTYFLDSGTLLGAYREHKVIRHDNDADFGIDSAALQYLREKPVAFPSQYFFTVWNSTLYPGSSRDDKLPARLIHRASGLYLDIFAFLDWKDDRTDAHKVGPLSSWCFMNCASCPRAASGGRTLRVPYEWIYPLADCEFEGVQLKCPNQTQTYLKYTFGRNFMTPVKYTYKK